MPANKVVINTENGAETVIDLTGDNVAEGKVFKGVIFHGADGNSKTGTFTIDDEISEQDDIISRIKTALQGKASGGGGGTTPTQEKTVDVVENGTVEVIPDAGYVLSKVTANVNVPIPSGYIKPSGTKNISANGTHNVKEYENVSVDVPIPDGYIKPSGVLEVTENGIHDVSVYQQVNVNVAASGEPDPRDQYQRVEYITTAEDETYPYVITDICADNSTGAEIVASFPILQDRVPMGSRQDSGTTRFYVVYPLSAHSVYYGFNTGSSASCALKVDTIYRLQTNFLNSRLVCVYENNGTRKANVSLSATLTSHTVPISIFGYNSASSGAVASKREYKLYSARISKNHEVIREYIPCYRKSDGEVGLYEKVTGTFLTNDGGGAFAKGADIEW